MPGLANVTVSRTGPNGLAYYPADFASSLWYASSSLEKSFEVQTFDWDVTFSGLAGPQPLLEVRKLFSGLFRYSTLKFSVKHSVHSTIVCHTKIEGLKRGKKFGNNVVVEANATLASCGSLHVVNACSISKVYWDL